VLLLKNMVDEDEEGLDEEVSEECQNYGKVLKVVIYEEKNSENPMEVDVKIFVKFETNGKGVCLQRLPRAWLFHRYSSVVCGVDGLLGDSGDCCRHTSHPALHPTTTTTLPQRRRRPASR